MGGFFLTLAAFMLLALLIVALLGGLALELLGLLGAMLVLLLRLGWFVLRSLFAIPLRWLGLRSKTTEAHSEQPTAPRPTAASAASRDLQQRYARTLGRMERRLRSLETVLDDKA
jgi:hypothetical protein